MFRIESDASVETRHGVVRSPVRIAGVVAAAVVCVAASAAPVQTGKTPGSFEVTPSGSASYTIPIAVPAGIAGLQPQLALHYDSQQPRGIAGPGWSLQGLDAVRRCQPTRFQNGNSNTVGRAITLTASDRFCLNGNRLVLDGASTLVYGAASSTYRTQIDNFARVTSLGSAGTGPASFKVETKDGRTIELGAANGAQVIPGAAVAGGAQPTTAVAWMVDKVTDRMGNTIAYTYAQDSANGAQVLSRIDYNGGKAYVKFAYTPDLAPTTSFLAGTRLSNSQLLTDIRTYVLDDSSAERMVKHYALGYNFFDLQGNTAAATPVGRLETVKECGSDDTCFRPISFQWNAWHNLTDMTFGASVSAANHALSIKGGVSDELQYKRMFADMDGDGKLDVVLFGSDGVYILYANDLGAGANNFSGSLTQVSTDFDSGNYWFDQTASSGEFPRHLIDMNHDGHPDIVGFHHDSGKAHNLPTGAGIYMATWNVGTGRFNAMTNVVGGAGKFVDNNWGKLTCNNLTDDAVAPRYLVDMDDDGYPDILGINSDGVWFARWDPSVNAFATPVSVSTQMKMDNAAVTGDCMGVDRQPIYLADMNGDGFADLVYVRMDGVHVMLWNPATQSFLAPNTTVFTEFKSDYRKNTLYPTWLIDMNGDGYPDLVNFSSGGIRVALWNGTSFNPSTLWTAEFPTSSSTNTGNFPRRIVDLNGDGYPDVLEFRSDGVWAAMSNGQGKIFPATLWTSEFAGMTKDAYNGNTWQIDTKTPRHLMDIDGDGIPEIVAFGDQDTRIATPTAPAGTRITTITDSLGASIKVTYTAAQGGSGHYYTEAAAWPVQAAHSPLLIVANTLESQQNGVYSEKLYRYTGRNVDFNQGALGFRQMFVQDLDTGLERRTTFSQTYPFIGMAIKRDLYQNVVNSGGFYISGCGADTAALCFEHYTASAGSLVTSAVDTPVSEPLGQSIETPVIGRVFPYVSKTVESRYELDYTLLPTKTTTYAYEEPRLVTGAKQWGNLTSTSVGYSDGNQVSTANTFEPAIESSWTLGRLSKSVVTSVRPAVSVTAVPPADAPAPKTPDQASKLPATATQIISIITTVLLGD